MYFREYFCSSSSKSYYFYILGVSHLNGVAIHINSPPPGQNGSHFTDDIFRYISDWENLYFDQNFAEVCSLGSNWQ